MSDAAGAGGPGLWVRQRCELGRDGVLRRYAEGRRPDEDAAGARARRGLLVGPAARIGVG